MGSVVSSVAMRISDQEANRLKVLRAIRRAEPVARTELVQLTGLPGWAISDLVGDLIQRDLLMEEKAPAVGRGRPRLQLRINPAGALVVGVMMAHVLTVEIANLRGDTLFGRTFELTYGPAEPLVQLIAASVISTIAESPFEKDAIHSVGVSIPGVVDSLHGVLHWLPDLQGGPVPLADMLSRRLELPVFLDSTGNVFTRAEHWFGDDRQVDDFTMIYVGFGIGFGQYVDGVLRTGDHGLNPEFGHIKVGARDGPPCYCGARGCLWQYASIAGIVEQICARRTQPTPPPLEPLMDAFRQFAAEARAGEPVAQEVFEAAGATLGVAVANHVNVRDPSRILVVVQDAALLGVFEAPFRAALHANTLEAMRERAPVHFKVNDDIASSKGAAALVLEQLYLGSAEDRRAGKEGRPRTRTRRR